MSATIKARFWFATEVQSPRLCLLLGPLTHFTRFTPRLDRKNLTIHCQTQTPYISKDSSCVSQVMPVLSPLLQPIAFFSLCYSSLVMQLLHSSVKLRHQIILPGFATQLHMSSPGMGFQHHTYLPSCYHSSQDPLELRSALIAKLSSSCGPSNLQAPTYTHIVTDR